MSLKLLLHNLSQFRDITVTPINTGGSGNGLLSLVWRLFRSISQALQKIPATDVVTLHLARPSSAPIFLALARLFHKPVILKMFGGADYRASGGLIERSCLKWAMRRAELTLLQTRRLVEMAKQDGARRVEWFSNSRPMPAAILSNAPRHAHCRRFVFVGHVNEDKGVTQIIAIDGQIPNDACIDVYGPLTNGFSREAFEGLHRVRYCGEVSSDRVMATLGEHDALVLPTHYYGEGYPGVILEAFAVGIPVITTSWLSIPEIADDSCALLVPPRNPQALADAVKRLYSDKDLYSRLCAGSAAKRIAFSAEHWTDVFVRYCREIGSERELP